MNKTKIEYVDYTWNPVTGCTKGCSYCYAKKIAMRFEGHFKPTFHPERLEQPLKVKKPSRILVCSMADLFAPYIRSEWITDIFSVIRRARWHKFFLLTKNPKRYQDLAIPQNAERGATVDTVECAQGLRFVNWISFEPLLADVSRAVPFEHIKWAVIGAQTNPHKPPKLKWVQNIVSECDELGIPVFMKNSLECIWPSELRKELSFKTSRRM